MESHHACSAGQNRLSHRIHPTVKHSQLGLKILNVLCSRFGPLVIFAECHQIFLIACFGGFQRLFVGMFLLYKVRILGLQQSLLLDEQLDSGVLAVEAGLHGPADFAHLFVQALCLCLYLAEGFLKT
ncbi:hypothetical protein [Faecalibaculum rodentium]|uniref:hypothetical protein n=1 Tax=Faecalibaculum rodentium TaxID=1702221 RepID=UPI001F598E97|nr:hypothetical protein [Faecalibaculum rodentium]